MRNINRIDPFCSKLAEYWKKAPDLRFGQLIVNVLGLSTRDPFFLEEDEMLELFDIYFDPAKRDAYLKKIDEQRKNRTKTEQSAEPTAEPTINRGYDEKTIRAMRAFLVALKIEADMTTILDALDALKALRSALNGNNN